MMLILRPLLLETSPLLLSPPFQLVLQRLQQFAVGSKQCSLERPKLELRMMQELSSTFSLLFFSCLSQKK